MTRGYPTLTTLQRSLEALMNSERDTQTIYEVFRDGKPKYQLIWTNNTKRFLIDGKIVSEQTWTNKLKKDKA
jgi:hypothetical protein